MPAFLILVGVLLTLGLPGGPGVFASEAPAPDGSLGAVEADAHLLPWPTLNRLALLAGNFPPHTRSLTRAELSAMLGDDGAAPREARAWARLLTEASPSAPANTSWRLDFRLRSGFTDRGSIWSQQAGLAWAPGWNTTLEPSLEWARGRFWAAVTGRLGGRVSEAGTTLSGDEPLSWPGWTNPSGLAQVRRARLLGGAWTGDLPRLLVGAQLGRWSLSAGWAARRTGPGQWGGLQLDQNGPAFPAVTARRTAPFVWSGIMTHAAPDHLLLRAGRLSEQTLRYQDEWGHVSRDDEPWFMQWLVGWDVTGWFRASFCQSTMANARSGTLWPDLLQVNFPVIGTTWREMESGPVTDRLFGVILEFRWSKAPLRFLPSRAGRAYWDYGGTDFLPSGPGGIIPQISIPASVAGCEMVGDRWDLAFEYAETFHDKGQWYFNGGFPEGYEHDQWLLGHIMGGGSESFHAQVRVRPVFLPVELRLGAGRTSWNHDRFFPTRARQESWRLEVLSRQEDHAGNGLPWQVVVERIRERVWEPAGTEADWWRGALILDF